MKKLTGRRLNLWNLCKNYVIFRADGWCELCKARGRKTFGTEVDHAFTRGISKLFYDTRNLTLLCHECHDAKGHVRSGIGGPVHEIVEKREGKDWYEKAKLLYSSKSGQPLTNLDIENLEKEISSKFEYGEDRSRAVC